MMRLSRLYGCEHRVRGGLCAVEPGECSSHHAREFDIKCAKNEDGWYLKEALNFRNVVKRMLGIQVKFKERKPNE